MVRANANINLRPEGPTDTSRGLQPPDPEVAECAAKSAPETVSEIAFGIRSSFQQLMSMVGSKGVQGHGWKIRSTFWRASFFFNQL